MNEEILWNIKEFHRMVYEVSADGKVYLNGEELKQYDCKGYLRVDVLDGVRRKCYMVHRLVAETFIPNPYNKPQVNHIDGDKTNNKVSNLEWVTAKENINHAIDIGLFNPEGESNFNNKLSEHEVHSIKRLIEEGHSNIEIGKLFDVSRSTIYAIRNNKTWRNLK